MSQFSFTTDPQSEQFCRDIIQGMMHYGISESEALHRLNEFWKGQTFVGKHDLRYHRDVEEWVQRIFSGPEKYLASYWAAQGFPSSREQAPCDH